jgi:conjugal transfer/entry exclusion protein
MGKGGLMLVTTLGARLALSGRSGVYVVRDGAGRVIYVGQSKDCGRRLQQHRRASSSFGQAIRSEESDNWRVALLSIEECAKVTGRPCRNLDDAEKAMIETMKPACNSQHNGGIANATTIGNILPDNVRAAIIAIGESRARYGGG